MLIGADKSFSGRRTEGLWGDASEPGVRRVPAGACGALRVPAAGAAVGDPAQGKNINMLYSAQLGRQGTSRVDANLQQVLIKCANACKSAASSRAASTFRGRLRKGFAGCCVVRGRSSFPRGVFPSFATRKIMTAEPRILALGCRFLE